MSAAAGLWAGRPRITRQAAALGVALALHGALVVAWGGRPEPVHGRGGPGFDRSPGPAVLWLRVMPAAAPVVTAEAPLASRVPDAAAADAAAPSEPAAGAGLVLDGTLQRQGAPWSLAYPDAELPARRLEMTLTLQLDAARQVQAAEAAGPASDELVQYVRGQLLGAVLDGAAPPERACLWLRFDADEARVEWRLVPPPSRAGRACPRPPGV